MPRPEDYTPEIGDRICSRLSAGEGVVSICKDEDMPGRTTFYRWLRVHPEFMANYVAAKEESADAMLEDMFDIAANEPDVKRARLQVDVRKWAASKLKPKKYGDRVVHSGDDDAPIAHKIELVPVKP